MAGRGVPSIPTLPTSPIEGGATAHRRFGHSELSEEFILDSPIAGESPVLWSMI